MFSLTHPGYKNDKNWPRSGSHEGGVNQVSNTDMVLVGFAQSGSDFSVLWRGYYYFHAP